jgi:proteic killer suppression protein
MINNAHTIIDLLIPPSNKLKKLKGNLNQFYSVRINAQWRIIFIWSANDAFEVQITDYHD